MKRLILFLGVFLLVCGGFQTVQAASAGEKIISFDSDVTITKSNVARITETILYDFGSTPRHGIYRDIPIDYQGTDGNYYLLSDYETTVDENGQEVQAEISETNGNQRIRLGDPDKTVTGVHTYVITYTLQPVVLKKQSKPFLNLDLVGAGWDVPIQKASAKVSLEDGKELQDVQCFAGAQGATTPCSLPSTNIAGVTTLTQTDLAPRQGMTINATVPNGYVTKFLEVNKQRPASFEDILFAILIPLGIVVGIVIAIVIPAIRYTKARAKRKKQIVVAQYEPPQTLSPAEIGHLEDDSSSMAEVTATIISLAVRGYLKITQSEKKGLGGIFGGKDYTLTALKNNEGLSAPEKTLYDALFEGGSEVKLNDLDKSTMASAITSFKSEVKKSLEEKGYYSQKGGIFQKGNLTDEGAKQWAFVDGFKLYLNVVEKDRLKFTDAPEKTPERFSQLLPYAVALGVEKQWAQQFEGIDVTPATNGWYVGSNMALFSASDLTNDLSSGFASTVTTNSSVSSGGGSSGGGFGGGGGGSW